MKLKILILLAIFFVATFAGGLALVVTIERRLADLENVIMLHQVENLREHLLLKIQKVEVDLYSQDTMHPQSRIAIENHLNEVETSIGTCFECHHAAGTLDLLLDLRHQILQYDSSVRGMLTLGIGSLRMREERTKAHLIGDSLSGKVETMLMTSNKNLIDRTRAAVQYTQKMELVIIAIISAGPLLMILFAFLVIRGVTKPVEILLGATRKLKSGDLDHRIPALQDEFGELAFAFNEMAGSLRATIGALEESEKRYRLLFERAAEAIFILQAEGERPGGILEANDAAAAMHGFTVDELKNLTILDLNTPEYTAGFNGRLDQILKGDWIKAEVMHRRKNGSTFPVEVSAGLIEVGGHRLILVLDRDITERKRAEKEQRRMERVRIAGELATGLAHEIKNPLAGIMASMQVLSEESSLAEEDRDILHKVINEIKRIEFLMKGLMNFANPPKQQLMLTDVNAILESVAGPVLQDCCRTRDREGSISLVRALDDALPEIMADPMQLRQIFLNLMLNAVDAMPRGGTLTLRTAFNTATQDLRVEISDTGSGIDPEAMSRIFTPFFSTKTQGTGLGLSITKRLIEDHGGTIRLQNNENGGVTCSIVLPVRQVEGALTI